MDHRRLASKSTTVIVLLLLLIAGVVPARAQSDPSTATAPLQVANQGNGVYLQWPSAVTAATALSTLPTVRFQGYDLPMQFVTLHLDDAVQAAALQVLQLDAVNWEGTLAPGAPLAPPVLDWGPNPEQPSVEPVALPSAPVFVLRQGQLHGQSVAVVAISPLYQENGQVKLATQVGAFVANAATLDTTMIDFLRASRAEAEASIRAAVNQIANLAPVNAAAVAHAIKVIVDKPGIQTITGQALANAGLDLNSVDPAKLHLSHKGAQLPLELDGLVSGKLTPTSSLRFYTPTVRDRWNLTEVYWLTSEATDGARMAARNVTPSGAPGQPTALEKGVWTENKLYFSERAGVDGDHWFHSELKFDPVTNPTATIQLNNVLPSASGSASFTLTMSTLAKASFKLQVKSGNNAQEITWNSAPQNILIPDWSHPIQAPAGSQTLALTLLNGDSKNDLALDQVTWQQPASLNFQGKGASFTGLDGTYTYQWQNLPTGFALYDITDPSAPLRLTGATSSGFQDGPKAHEYIVAGPGTLHEPTLVDHEPVTVSSLTGAQAIYIAPQEFFAALEPLLAHRQAEGYSVALVDVEEIYDAWSYGQVSAEAIRTFLRFAAATWQPAPISVVLVGDGTWDPHNYENKASHINFIPPYVADVDPWLGEAACEACFAQLDGDDPLTGDFSGGASGNFFAADLWIGRLSIRTAQELTNLVNKIVRYETDTTLGAWRGTSIFLADNHVQSLQSNGTPVYDAAGDFATISDEIVNTVDPQTRIQRIYYDPHPNIDDPDGSDTWRVTNATSTKNMTLAALSAGAGLVTFNGHAHHWQWARFDGDESVAGFVTLYDTDILTNNDRFFITLSMTCLTSQFHKPADAGTVLDERMLLNPTGGAIATWGPSGLSVVHGHDALQHGFHTALRNAPPMTARLGELIEAGNTELLTHSTCCQDALQTFLLLGDPLTPARIMPLDFIYLPLANR